MSPARDFALAQLDDTVLPGWKTHLLRRRVAAPADPRDLALAEQLRVGVIKNLLWLRALIEHHAHRPIDQVDPLVQKIVSLGLYQLRFLDRVPRRAAVDEAAEQARRFGRTRAVGFVNAVLRNATRQPDPPDAPPHLRWSHPEDVLQRLAAAGRSQEQVQAFLRHSNSLPPTVVRLCAGASADALRAEGVTATPHDSPGLFVVAGARQAVLADWSARGIAQPQDATSAGVVPHLALRAGQVVLDRCCGVGTKTMQIWEQVGPGGKVFAMDPNADRCATLRRALAERRVENVGVIESAWRADAKGGLPESFDAALLDVPCSNSGVFARRPEARYRHGGRQLRTLSALQAKILDDTAEAIAPGGRLVYSTCSVWAEENGDVVHPFLDRHRGFQLLTETLTWPESDAGSAGYRDGGYVAAMMRRG